MNDLKIPKIRFAQYTDSWVLTPLSGLVASVDSGWSPQCDHGVAVEGEWGVLKTTSVQWTGFESDKNKKLPQALEPRENLSLREDDILVTRAGPNERVGVVSRVDRDYPKLMLSDKIIRLRTKTGTNPNYLALSLSLKKNNYQIMSKASGLATSQTNISQKFLLQTRLGIPTLPEQQKIASFLSNVDEKIGLLSEKKDKLTEYKRGVMQQLFNGKWHEQDGQLTFIPPTLRFKADDGSEYPDWKEDRIGGIGSFYYGKSAPKWSVSKEATIPCVRYGELYNKFSGTVDKIYSRTSIPKEKLKFSRGGEVLVPRVGEDPLDFAKCSYLPFSNIAIGEMISVFNSEEDGQFMATFFRATCQKKFAKLVEGGSVSNLYFRYLENIRICIPTKNEQLKISDFISKVNGKLELVDKELEKAKEWKKGLLQQMFV
ncbi:restriction endonuclease subunit S [Vibrio splendidus]|uniref:Restriction endonuclease subunit S n=1 Tax=Vibrio splendidus TaxID=29497 RepID=A0A2T5EPP3_VIBSP|nr:restriction endonuclease subunit S [Vibrio splendidus]PTP23807.1 restriction endonuclease subunit S [Vibrio splendidus]